MSDQETKVAEVADTPVVDTTNEAKPEAVEAKAEDTTTKSDVEDKTATEAVEAVEEAKTGTNEAAEAADSKDDVKTEDGPVSVNNPPKNMLKVRRPDGRRDDKKNNKFDPSIKGDSDDPKEIREQVEFYFGDSNLTTDNFLAEQTGLAENKPVPLATLCSFKRMRRYKPYSAVVSALKDSKFLVVEGEEGAETIRRKNAFDPSTNKTSIVEARSIYVKGFGGEDASTQFDIEAFFSKYGSFNQVRLRRGDDAGFKGSVFVEWADKETAEKFMALDPKPQWKDHDLLILWKVDYMKEKNEMIKAGLIQPGRGHHRGRGRGNRGRGGDGARRDSDKDDWKTRRDEDQKNGHNDRRGGRGGRGRGRGRGRGGNRDRNEERRSGEEKPRVNTGDERPTINVGEKPNSNGKRAREDEAKDTPPAKKVDAKETTSEAA